MKTTRASSHAIIAAVLLAHQQGGSPVTSCTIAKADGLPRRSLLRFFKPLMKAGLLRAHMGPGGG